MDSEAHRLHLQAMNQRVEIQPYDPAWPERFAIERARLLQLFPETFLGIEHVGSTAVAGLAAKPVIDIMAGVASLRVADELLEPLCKTGYDTSKEFNATLKDRRWLMLHKDGKRTHHLHLVIYGETDWRRMLAFRDALRADRNLAERYESLKRNLAEQHAGNRDAYTAAKTGFILGVIGA